MKPEKISLEMGDSGQQELGLLENVELRFALADDNAKFASQLDAFLSAVLLKLASPHQAVQNKVPPIPGRNIEHRVLGCFYSDARQQAA